MEGHMEERCVAGSFCEKRIFAEEKFFEGERGSGDKCREHKDIVEGV
jgi:hypothetical protein